jgi:hypothetical protein
VDDVNPELLDASDSLIVFLLPIGSSERPCIAPTEPLARSSMVAAKRGSERIEWRPGIAVARCDPSTHEEVASSIVEFAFFERELRLLEAFVKETELQAQIDLPAAHRIHGRDRSRWVAMGHTFERVTGARLTFARLEPQFEAGSRSLGLVGRRWFSLLLRRARIAARLEAASDRLEALEDFYEGGTQRIAEYRWYREGHLLETGIIGILVFECFLMIGEIILHLRH